MVNKGNKIQNDTTHHGETEAWTNNLKTQNQGWEQWGHHKTENPCALNMPENQEQEQSQRLIQIWQQNINKSIESQHDLLESLKWNVYDVYTIHKPYIDFKGKMRANWNWTTVYPNTHDKYPDRTRSIILANANLSTDAWKQVKFKHPDITAVKIQGQFSTLQIINVYNDCKNNNTLTHISTFMWDRETATHNRPAIHHMVGRLQLTPPTVGWGLECTSIYKGKPGSSTATTKHARTAQHEDDAPSLHSNTMFAQHRQPHLSWQWVLHRKSHGCGNKV
jgi:hypothetical protein